MNSPIDKKLDDVALKQFVWKNQCLLAACLLIARKAIESPIFWPDEIKFPFLTSDDDRNLIGSAWRQCSKTLGIVEKTGLFRRSSSEDANGRTIFQYKLVDGPVAQAFLKRHGVEKTLADLNPQLSLL